jgi:hypothetical protein
MQCSVTFLLTIVLAPRHALDFVRQLRVLFSIWNSVRHSLCGLILFQSYLILTFIFQNFNKRVDMNIMNGNVSI